jgi:Barstar (barnase inhibitor)
MFIEHGVPGPPITPVGWPYPGAMPRLGVRDGEPQTVDLTTGPITSWKELWDALEMPCALPGWFGRNLNAWNDTLGTGAISAVLDAHSYLIIRVLDQGLFAPGNVDGVSFAEVTAQTGEGRVEIQK